MSFLREYLPAPIVDFLPLLVVLILALVFIPRIIEKLKETGVWDRLVDKIGGDRYRQMQFEREINRMLKRGDIIGAAQLYEEAEWYPEAINLYLEAEEYTAAGDLYERLEQWDQAAEMYTQADDWKRAAKLYAQRGHPDRAAQLSEQHGQKMDAAKLYFEAGRFDRAAQLYEEVSYFPQAAKSYENMGELLKAAENYEKHWSATTSFGGGGLIAAPSDREARVAMKAGQLYEQAGALDKAAALYRRAGLAQEGAELAVRMGRYEEAGEMFLKEEKLERAAEMFEKAGKDARAALLRGEVAFHQGDHARAAEEFVKGGDPLRAAELFEAAGDFVSAARCYEQSQSPLQAANVYLRADKKEEAAAMYEQGRNFDMAAKLYAEAGRNEKASALYEDAGRHYEAGRLACELGDIDRAISLLQQIDPDSEHYESATLILSRLFIDRGMASLAVEKLLRVLGNRPISPQTLEHFYHLGRAYEKLDKRREAVETFKKVMAERYGYADVEQRLAGLTGARLPEAAAPAPALVPARPTAPAPKAESQAPPAPQPAAPAPKIRPQPPPTPQPSAKPGAASRIQVKEKLGEGLLGETFKGIDTRSGQTIAVKFLREDLLRDRNIVQRLVAEARVAKSLQHQCLVRLLGLAEIDGKKAAITEYVEGPDLASILRRSKRLTVKQGLHLLSMLSVALGLLHKNKLLHRDLKMTNILVAKGGMLRLAGTGLGALRTPQLGPADGYPSPEFLGGQAVDERSDIYSLGALIFHGLTGVNPVAQNSAPDRPPSLGSVLPGVPEPLDRIVTRCLAGQPAKRFRNIGELISAASLLRAG